MSGGIAAMGGGTAAMDGCTAANGQVAAANVDPSIYSHNNNRETMIHTSRRLIKPHLIN